MYNKTSNAFILWVLCLISLNWYSAFSNAQMGPCRLPPDFPPGIKLQIQSFEATDKGIQIPFSYVATPRTSQQVVTIANWAYQTGYRVRAKGSQHTYTPFIFSPTDNHKSCPMTILVDTTKYFTSMIVNPRNPFRPDLHSVSLGTGVKLRTLLAFLEENGLGLFACPSIGSPTIGDIIATGAHGSGMYSDYDKKSPGHTYGTISNLIIQMTIVAWDEISFSYVLKTLHRSDEDIKAFLVNLGRTFVTSVVLRVGKDQMLRSQSHFFISSQEAFAHPDVRKENTRTISKFADSYGRINAVWLPPGNQMWILTWHTEPMKPPKSRKITRPLNYYFMNFFPRIIDPLVRSTLKNLPSATKLYSVVGYPSIVARSYLTRSVDYWGPSKNHLTFSTSIVAPSMSSFAFVLVTSRSNLQLVLWIYRSHFDDLTEEYDKVQQYPISGGCEIRITGLDDPKDVEIDEAESPSFSPIRPVPEYPDFNIGVWIESIGYSDTPHFYEFMTRLQTLLYRDIHGKYAILRPEWSKGWASTYSGPWSNDTVMNHYARTFSTSNRHEEWNWAVRKLNSYDPHHVFSNLFLDEFLVEH